MSLEPARVGECDTPFCEGAAETITPNGYVCSSCAAKIAVASEQAHERDTRGER
ncbi:hypothetical protein SAMN04487967_1716 [Natronorubrum sediminis]|uniref:Uncharacterized protein n=1 Tax=Natronorubrum sediminis TaxID=640943 RepID=A0A1H6FWJ8_9EURY|nr:hypothetical protein [Natronorubrum sediminis]SEH14680.1 hypothetical protein SAMN04487967_1716 [Natronorubrum sediminis]